jgi:hypothetical protein
MVREISEGKALRSARMLDNSLIFLSQDWREGDRGPLPAFAWGSSTEV